MREISLMAGDEIVDANDFITLQKQAIAKMRSDESGSPGNKDTLHWKSSNSPPAFA